MQLASVDAPITRRSAAGFSTGSDFFLIIRSTRQVIEWKKWLVNHVFEGLDDSHKCDRCKRRDKLSDGR